MASRPKYSIAEVERRWLVEPDALGAFEGKPYFEIEDLYIAGTQLRLRKIERAGSPAMFKLCKKYGKANALSEAITNLYLSEAEYRLLVKQLSGNTLRKRRYPVAGGALDIYPDSRLAAMFEIEFQSEAEARSYEPPPFARQEVTDNEAYAGAALAAVVCRRTPKLGSNYADAGFP